MKPLGYSALLLYVRLAVKGFLLITVCNKKVLYFALERKIKIYPFVGSDSFANKGFSCRYPVSRYAVTYYAVY